MALHGVVWWVSVEWKNEQRVTRGKCAPAQLSLSFQCIPKAYFFVIQQKKLVLE